MESERLDYSLRMVNEITERRIAEKDAEWREWLIELDRKHSGRQGSIWAEIVDILDLFGVEVSDARA